MVQVDIFLPGSQYIHDLTPDLENRSCSNQDFMISKLSTVSLHLLRFTETHPVL